VAATAYTPQNTHVVQTELCVVGAASPWALSEGILHTVRLHLPVVHILDLILNVLLRTAVDSRQWTGYQVPPELTRCQCHSLEHSLLDW
jgi:hypothetical protein